MIPKWFLQNWILCIVEVSSSASLCLEKFMDQIRKKKQDAFKIKD